MEYYYWKSQLPNHSAKLKAANYFILIEGSADAFRRQVQVGISDESVEL